MIVQASTNRRVSHRPSRCCCVLSHTCISVSFGFRQKPTVAPKTTAGTHRLTDMPMLRCLALALVLAVQPASADLGQLGRAALLEMRGLAVDTAVLRAEMALVETERNAAREVEAYALSVARSYRGFASQGAARLDEVKGRLRGAHVVRNPTREGFVLKLQYRHSAHSLSTGSGSRQDEARRRRRRARRGNSSRPSTSSSALRTTTPRRTSASVVPSSFLTSPGLT